MDTCFLIILLMITAKCNAAAEKLPNIVFILTDDQDTELGGVVPMQKTQRLIGNQGMIFKNMFVSSPLCCPSRASIFTGQYVHNHRTFNNSLNGGCSDADWQQLQEPISFPVYLKGGAGYTTMFAGKYLNNYGFPEAGGVQHIPLGWDWWFGLVGNSRYYDYSLSVNGVRENHGHNYNEDYFTNYISKKAEQFLSLQSPDAAPFFMMLSTPACHDPFTPADPYMFNFSSKVAPRGGSYNISAKEDKHWLIRQGKVPLPNDSVEWIDSIFRNRWRTLLSVDDMVESVYKILDQKDLLNNTYIFFSSDNGFHLGQFGLTFDKRQLYEFDIRVPLMVRGPGIKPGQVTEVNAMNIDLASTFINIAKLDQPGQMDGRSLLPVLTGQQLPGNDSFRTQVLIEHHGESALEIPGCPQLSGQGLEICDAHCICEDSWNNTFSCIREDRPPNIYKYCIIKEDEDFVELYELNGDNFELNNLAEVADSALLKSLKTSLANLSTCAGSEACTRNTTAY